MKVNNRTIISIDYLRTIAIILVVLCHSVEEGVYHFTTQYMAAVSMKSEMFAHIIFSFGRLGVPFFIMISGFLLLTRDYDKEKRKKFWKNNFIRLLITFEVWVLIYRLFGIFVLNWPLNPIPIIKEMLLVRKVDLSHIWYMPMIIGMYLFIPVVATAIKDLEYKTIFVLVVLSSMFLFGVPTINVILQILGRNVIWQQIDLSFSGGIYGIYLMIGYLINKRFFSNVDSILLFFVSIISFLLVVVMQIYAYKKGIAYNVWYDNLFLLICTASIMELAVRKEFKYNFIVSNIAKNSFAIYMIHMCYKHIFLPKLNLISTHRSIEVIFFWIIMLSLSYLTAILLNNIPGVGKMLFYIKEKNKK